MLRGYFVQGLISKGLPEWEFVIQGVIFKTETELLISVMGFFHWGFLPFGQNGIGVFYQKKSFGAYDHILDFRGLLPWVNYQGFFPRGI